MYLIMPKEIRKLERIFEPYLVNCSFIEGTPKEAIEAFEKYSKWIDEAQGDYQ